MVSMIIFDIDQIHLPGQVVAYQSSGFVISSQEEFPGWQARFDVSDASTRQLTRVSNRLDDIYP